MNTLKYDGPIVLAVLDGFGLADSETGNAVQLARAPFLKSAMKNYPTAKLEASGEAVGVPKGDMGNSEVGHNALGTGQIYKQGPARVDEVLKNGEVWATDTWKAIIDRLKTNNSTLHLSGIFSDGNVHANVLHFARIIYRAHEEGIKKIRVHAVLDGRDVPPQSAEKYLKDFNDFAAHFDDADYQIASGGGRMVFVADRYESDWGIVKAGWDAIVHGSAKYKFTSALEAVTELRKENPKLQDQYIPPFVIVDPDTRQPVGKVSEGDAFLYLDFRADRAVEIARAFTYEDFPHFDRGFGPDATGRPNRRPDIFFAGMTEYDSDLHVPEHQLVPPITMTNPLNQFLGSRQISQLALSETVKFGHITYYFNGNSYEKADKEDHLEIKSDTRPFNERPWMKAAEITDALLENIEHYKFIRVNFPNPDMVGHIGELDSTILAIEAVDLELQRIAAAVDKLGGALVITADHGNAEELLDAKGQPKTSHSTNKVPCIFYDNTKNAGKYQLRTSLENPGLANVASTISLLLGQNLYPSNWKSPLIELKF